jgi:hypothetical protein
MAAAGRNTADILLGKIDILECLFPGGSMDMAVGYYEEDLVTIVCNETAVEALKEIDAQIFNIHVFEIGSGIGGIVSSLLLLMNAWVATLAFTDLSDIFLINACMRFQEHFPFIEYCIFDACTDPQC